jgi:hypothetical protein
MGRRMRGHRGVGRRRRGRGSPSALDEVAFGITTGGSVCSSRNRHHDDGGNNDSELFHEFPLLALYIPLGEMRSRVLERNRFPATSHGQTTAGEIALSYMVPVRYQSRMSKRTKPSEVENMLLLLFSLVTWIGIITTAVRRLIG